MIEIMYDISSGSNYKFNTAFIGEQVHAHAMCQLVFVSMMCLCFPRRKLSQLRPDIEWDVISLARFQLRLRSVVVHPEAAHAVHSPTIVVIYPVLHAGPVAQHPTIRRPNRALGFPGGGGILAWCHLLRAELALVAPVSCWVTPQPYQANVFAAGC